MLIAFDLEGTLIDGELFTEVGLKLGLGDELEAVTRDAMNGDLPFGEALEKRVEMIKGISMSSIRSIASSLHFTRGAEETVTTLRRMGLIPAIITGGFEVLAAPVAEKLGVDHVYANRLDEIKGRVAGLKPPVVTPRAKAEYLKLLTAHLGVPLEHSIAVGDGANDVPMICTAGLGIAFDAPARVREAAHASVCGGDLRGLLPIVAHYLDEANHAEPLYREQTPIRQ